MPNWCSNNLTVSGDAIKVKSFFNNGIHNGVWRMSLYFPMPIELETTTAPTKEPSEDLIKRFGYDNWYDWRCANYGTKWDANSDNYGDDYVRFETAWSPPLPWLQKVAMDYPELTFRIDYSEEGMQFGGTCVALHMHNTFKIANQQCDLVMQDEYGVSYDWSNEHDRYINRETGEEVAWDEFEGYEHNPLEELSTEEFINTYIND
jgi:hypothetical protein